MLGAFALCFEGKKLGNKFSEQRRWLTSVYEKEMSGIDDKREFVRKLSRTANFFYYGWYLEETTVPNYINGLHEHEDGNLASFLVQYLKDANSRLSVPILARFYCQLLDGQTTEGDFVECAKACAAFFTLWRSANSTSGLDDIYRRYFRGSDVKPGAGHSWRAHPNALKVGDLKRNFVDLLKGRGIAEEESWIAASERFLIYSELKTVCRFVLFVAGHDRVADEANPGLTSAGTRGACTMLNPSRWKAKDCKSLEHVAPQNPPTGHTWSADIYADDVVHQVGNLMLLPLDVNRFVDNKGWGVKYLHYCHVGERDKGKLDQLRDAAKSKGIVLSKRATSALSKVRYVCAVEPILSVGEAGVWHSNLIVRRTRQIKKIAWEKLFSWLQP